MSEAPTSGTGLDRAATVLTRQRVRRGRPDRARRTGIHDLAVRDTVLVTRTAVRQRQRQSVGTTDRARIRHPLVVQQLPVAGDRAGKLHSDLHGGPDRDTPDRVLKRSVREGHTCRCRWQTGRHRVRQDSRTGRTGDRDRPLRTMPRCRPIARVADAVVVTIGLARIGNCRTVVGRRPARRRGRCRSDRRRA